MRLLKVNYKEVSLFLTKFRILHHLHISMVDGYIPFCEFRVEDLRLENSLQHPLWSAPLGQLNHRDFVCDITTHFFDRPTADLIVTLKLQIAIVSQTDAKLFIDTLSLAQNLRALAISLVAFDELAIRQIPTNLSILSGLKTFGILIDCVDWVSKSNSA